MNTNLRRALGGALIESIGNGNDGAQASRFVEQLMLDITMPHDTAVFEITLPDGVTKITVTAVVTIEAPEVQP